MTHGDVCVSKHGDWQEVESLTSTLPFDGGSQEYTPARKRTSRNHT